jgi:MFS family permease
MGAVAYLVLILPLIPILKESPESMGLLPDGANPDAVRGAREAVGPTSSSEVQRLRRYYDGVDFKVREALHTSSFWYLLTGTMFRQVSRVGIDLHYVAILQWKDLDLSVAALIFTLRLGMNVPSKLIIGYFGDRVSKPAILSGGMILYALGLVLLLSSSAVWVLVVSAIISGMSEGITPVNWGAIGDYFGRRHYATLRGIINLSYSWALLSVPFAAGWWFDQYESYTVPIVVSAIASVVSVVFYALMRQPKQPDRITAVEPT